MDLPAGDFSSWLHQVRNALLNQGGIGVACGKCIGCCSSSYFIHITPLDRGALGRIPEKLLFPAPGRPKGHALMGYDREGLCPMLQNGKCVIYEHRPKTCRTYDCRVFAAAGIAAGGEDKRVINKRVEQWRFSYPTGVDRDEQRAVQAAARFVQEHDHVFPGGHVPTDPGQLAILAIKVYDLFLKEDAGRLSDASMAKAVVNKSKEFDAMMTLSARRSSKFRDTIQVSKRHR